MLHNNYIRELKLNGKFIKSYNNEKLKNIIKKINENYINLLYEKEISNEVNISNIPTFHLILSGGGLKGYYLSGISHILYNSNIINKIKSIRGCSCGALGAVYIACNINIYKWTHSYYLVMEEIKKGKNIIDSVYIVNDLLLPDNAHEICNEKNVEIIATKITNYKFEQVVFSKYESKKHLLDCISASICIPFIIKNNFPYSIKIKNDYYIDGGFISNTPIKITNEHQLVISNFLVEYPILYTYTLTDPKIEKIIIKGLIDCVDFFKNNKKINTINFHKNHNKKNNKLNLNSNNQLIINIGLGLLGLIYFSFIINKIIIKKYY